MFTSNSATNTNHAIDALATKSVRYVPLSSSVNQFTMRTIRTDRQCFGVYTLWHHVHRSQIVKPLSPSVNQFTMCTIRTDRQCFGVYPLAPCAPFTDRETTVTIRQPIHHLHRSSIWFTDRETNESPSLNQFTICTM